MIALSNASPIYGGKLGLIQSQRNYVNGFPKPQNIDVGGWYESPEKFNAMKEQMIRNGDIFRWPNHLYILVRPKGGGRIELRALDLVTDRDLQEATALYYQLKLTHLLIRHKSENGFNYAYDDDAVRIFRRNERQAAKLGAFAQVDKSALGGNKKITIQEQVRLSLDNEVRPLAEVLGVADKLKPLEPFIYRGENEALRIIERFKRGSNYNPNYYPEFVKEEILSYQKLLIEQVRGALARINDNSSDVSKKLKRFVLEVFGEKLERIQR